MKIATVLGTRTEIIRLNLAIKVIDQHCEQIIIHTGEEPDEALCDAQFRELDLRLPDIRPRDVGKDFATVLDELAATRVLTARPGVPDDGRMVFSFGPRAFGSVSLVHTPGAREEAISTGLEPAAVISVGDPTREVLDSYSGPIAERKILRALKLRPYDYFVATLGPNDWVGTGGAGVDPLDVLAPIAARFGKPVLVTVHPRTRPLLESQQAGRAGLRLLATLPFFDFVHLIKNSLGVITDSASVHTECCLLGTPSIGLSAENTPAHLLACGSTVVAGSNSEAVLRAVELTLGQPAVWDPPPECRVPNVSQIVSRIVLGEAFAR